MSQTRVAKMSTGYVAQHLGNDPKDVYPGQDHDTSNTCTYCLHRT